MASEISYTDDTGFTTFSNGVDAPGDRFCAWEVLNPTIGPQAEALGTGEGFVFPFRTDYGMAFEIREIAQDNVAAAMRLMRHLNNYGEVTVTTGDAASHEYVCKKWKGADPSLSKPDPRTLMRVLKLTLKSTTATDCIVLWP